MAEPTPEDVTLNTLHEDLIACFRNMTTREDSQEMIRLLRQRIRILKRRPPQIRALDARIREQSLLLQQILRALSEEIQRLRRHGDGEPIA